MITQTTPTTIADLTTTLADWKRELRAAVSDVDELLALLRLSSHPLAKRLLRDSSFPLRVPRPFIARMKPGDPDDPLLRQVLPLTDEHREVPGFSEDPLQESGHNPVPGIVHKYRGRVLLITTPVCAVNCRYCFRRHFPYEENTPGKRQWLDSLNYIADDPSISEVILSGGDPLATDDRHLHWLVSRIESIGHIRRLRIHTRLPVVIPSRIDSDCLAWMTATRLKLCVVVHINHSREIDADLCAAIDRLRLAGVPVFNQSVVLKGVNDSADILAGLSEMLFDIGVIPYYLHLLDPVAGASHFHTEQAEALDLYRQLQARLPGYLVPRLVRDIPGESAKMIINP